MFAITCHPVAVGVPSGTILIWNKAVEEIPAGFALCDGTNGTPDLRDKFIYGGGTGAGKSLHATGGAETHTLTSNQMPSHRHKLASNSGQASDSAGLGGTNCKGGVGGVAASGGDVSGYFDTDIADHQLV